MLEQRSLKLDLVALGLLALTVFLAASLLSYDPADSPSQIVYPAAEVLRNACGRSGAMVSAKLFEYVGLGAYYILVSLAVLDAILLSRRPLGQPIVRTIGWLMSLAGFSTLAAMALPNLSPGPVIGAGGYLGATGRGLLEMNFASVGSYIFITSVILGGLLLSTDYILFHVLAWTFDVLIKGFGGGVLKAGGAYAERLAPKSPGASGKPSRKRKSDIDNIVVEEESPAAPAIRIAGRTADQVPAADAASTSADAPQPDVGRPPAAAEDAGDALRVRKPRKSKKEELIEEIEAASNVQPEADDFQLPALDLLMESEPVSFDEHEKDVRRKARILEKTFADFGFNIRVVEIQTGPVIAQFEVELEAGLRLSKITGLADDLAIALRVPSVRIVAPIPGKNTVGIEVPNADRQLVRLRDVIEETDGKAQSMRIPIFLGKDVAGDPMTVDLASMPHLLIAGRTGTGKSVCLNSIIVSMLMTRRPDEVRMLLIDPKMVELSPYKAIPHLMHPVVTDMRKAEAILGWAVEKMEERYQLLARAGVRHLASFNQLSEEELKRRIQPEDEAEWEQIPRQMPYIVIVADEMADLMMTAAKEVEGHIIRLAQKSRAVGIHLVLATQKPTVDVITGLIKSNLPARICFQVTSRTDSRVVLDEMGADRLLGNGDMLFLRPGTSALVRGQGTYLSDDEIVRVIEAVATNEPDFIKELVQLKTSEESGGDGPALKSRDDLYEAAIDVVVREQRGSVSLLQRSLGIGYGRAARLIDFMAEDGIVGPYNGSQAREILLKLDDWEKMRAGGDASAAAPAPRRSNKITLGTPRRELDEADREDEEREADELYDEEETDEEQDEMSDDEYADEEEYDDEEEGDDPPWSAESA